MELSNFPRIRFGHFPTPLEPLKRLSSYLDGPKIYIKRDDCTGLATGGNKTRKLEFLIGAAIKKNADIIVTQGAVQSNHARITAAACNMVGLDCELLLERRIQNTSSDYEVQGNVLLDKLLGASLKFFSDGQDMNDLVLKRCEELIKQGRRPYPIFGGGSTPTGALGYVNCASELAQQFKELNLNPEYIVHGSGSAGTQAGLVAGFAIMNIDMPILGVSVRNSLDKQKRNVYDLACNTIQKLGIKAELSKDIIQVDDNYVGPGYGLPAASTNEAINLVARLEGILLDPVYSGKGMAGLIGSIKSGFFTKGQVVVFVHTGGQAALFAYADMAADII